MKKPIEPSKPWDWEYGLGTYSIPYEEICLYKDRLWFLDEQDRIEEYEDDMEDHQQITHPNKPIFDSNRGRYNHGFPSKMSLQDLINLLPKDIPLSEIYFHWEHPRYLEHFDLSFVYHKPINKVAKKKEYNRDMDEYKKKLKVYQEEMKKYKEFEKQKKIQSLESELSKLKS